VNMSLDLFVFFLEKATLCTLGDWSRMDSVSDDLYYEIEERTWRNFGRLKSYAMVAKEKQQAKDHSAAKFFLNILEKECGYSPSMTFPNVNTWWPDGLNHGLDDIYKKHTS